MARELDPFGRLPFDPDPEELARRCADIRRERLIKRRVEGSDA